MFKKIIKRSIDHPGVIILLMAIVAVVALVQFPRIKVDTDPENMLPYDHPVRVFDRQMKKEFALYDYLVIGIINEKNPNGVFNKDTLKRVYNLTEGIKKLDGVVSSQIMALSTKDNVTQDGVGAVRFNWLMPGPPKTDKEALTIRDAALTNPIFRGAIVSTDGKALCIYVALKEKQKSYEISQQIRKMIKKDPGEEDYYFAGIPVAEDQFGVEMFRQMAVSVPISGLVIFLLMRLFFKSSFLVFAPMLMAMATVFITMGVLIGLGYPVHIMSSMIPIFLMPIAVLDSIHILSEFFDKYRLFNDRKKTITYVMYELFNPMLFTSLTSAAGFFSLSFSPIPPVQVFGVFVAAGVLLAWFLTVTFIPAYVMLLDKKIFEDFGHVHAEEKPGLMDKLLGVFKNICLKRYKFVLLFTTFLVCLSIYGISKIVVNDNPILWFTYNHPIRVGDRVLNKHFSGTYEAYLILDAKDKKAEAFKDPRMLRYVERLQKELEDRPNVGLTTSLVDILKKIYDELLGGGRKNYVIPQTRDAVAQSVFTFESSHQPDDVWHLVTPDFSKLNIWLRLKSGQNKDMVKLINDVQKYIRGNPPPYDITVNWAGLTYLNVVWQQNMVKGMQKNFLGSFIIVLFMMLMLFRSPVKALISMVPLTVTILFIYSLLGFFGKDYDMPVAVLSALTLGLSIDFAIHFIQRAIEVNEKTNDWTKTANEMFAGPGRAIIRNALVVAIGFLPLLLAPLVPYKTVGFFMFTIMAISSLATLFILPAITSFSPEWIFEKRGKKIVCRCSDFILIAVFVAGAAAYLLMGYSTAGWEKSTVILIGIVIAAVIICNFISKKLTCKKGAEK